ncbi:hypothetical protein PPERSA_02447 [Pseudocohnilembus persalinus]|uniref:Tetratricopeptide repeat protein n=1 Tax=Pseudocohnilembus persalinus TaxID=266149 RepID=A0A0V0QB76_PSEPJ|nr:hypothetical protein PPERSA_02447 [Pseudocohnilembus persalinus]|eukprot:KRW99335.1 hypothetical protein PPERSA_02447 [Pseudocohnilembus persalinus]
MYNDQIFWENDTPISKNWNNKNSQNSQKNENSQQQKSILTDNEEDEQPDSLSQPLFDELKELDQEIQNNNNLSEFQILELRKKQMAIIKLLVFVHNKSFYLMVNAETALGEAYYNYECYEQALYHLILAERRNSQLYGDNSQRILYQINILILLGKCNFKLKEYQDALDYLEQAKDFQNQQNQPSFETTKLIASCLQEMEKYEQALQLYDEALEEQKNYNKQIKLEKVNEQLDEKDVKEEQQTMLEQQAQMLVDKAKTLALQEKYFDAIRVQKLAIDKFVESQSSKIVVAEQFKTLSVYQCQSGQIQNQIISLNNILELFKTEYGPFDKRVIKIIREIAIEQMKQGNQQDALTNLYQSEKIEEKVYGFESLNVAKTQKIIGQVLILLSHYEDAKRYLEKSIKIYDKLHYKKDVEELKQKIRFIKDLKRKDLQEDSQQQLENEGKSETSNMTEKIIQQQNFNSNKNSKQELEPKQIINDSQEQQEQIEEEKIQDKKQKLSVQNSQKRKTNEQIIKVENDPKNEENSENIQQQKQQQYSVKQQIGEERQIKEEILDFMFEQNITDSQLLQFQNFLNSDDIKSAHLGLILKQVQTHFKELFQVSQVRIYVQKKGIKRSKNPEKVNYSNFDEEEENYMEDDDDDYDVNCDEEKFIFYDEDKEKKIINERVMLQQKREPTSLNINTKSFKEARQNLSSALYSNYQITISGAEINKQNNSEKFNESHKQNGVQSLKQTEYKTIVDKMKEEKQKNEKIIQQVEKNLSLQDITNKVLVSAGICGNVYRLEDFQYLKNSYNNNPFFNASVDLKTQMPIICFTIYQQDRTKIGVIQCQNPQGISSMIYNQNNDKPSIQQLKLFQFGLILCNNIEQYQ